MVLADDSYLPNADKPELTEAGTIQIGANAPFIVCDECGAVYRSTGKRDPGICPECRKRKILIGGPLDTVSEVDA